MTDFNKIKDLLDTEDDDNKKLVDYLIKSQGLIHIVTKNVIGKKNLEISREGKIFSNYSNDNIKSHKKAIDQIKELLDIFNKLGIEYKTHKILKDSVTFEVIVTMCNEKIYLNVNTKHDSYFEINGKNCHGSKSIYTFHNLIERFVKGVYNLKLEGYLLTGGM